MKRALVLLVLILGFFWVGIGYYLLSQPKIIVVPHHNVVASLRAQFIFKLSQKRLITRRIVLLSTDHFGRNQHRLITTSPNESLFRLAAADDQAIYADHGIMNILPDIRASFPQASVHPLLLGNEVRISELTSLLTQIQTFCRFDCVVIASVDFSHYLPAAIAMTHDRYSIQALENRDATAVWKAETDSPQVLWLVSSLATNWDASRWTTQIQTNSSLIINDPWYESTSHVFGWYQRGLPTKRLETQSFTVVTATASTQLASLGNRLTYGSDRAEMPCGIPLGNEMVATGWETGDTLYIGLLPLSLTPKGYTWRRQQTPLPAHSTCDKKVILLPGTVN